jgi:hypothetical protein
MPIEMATVLMDWNELNWKLKIEGVWPQTRQPSHPGKKLELVQLAVKNA